MFYQHELNKCIKLLRSSHHVSLHYCPEYVGNSLKTMRLNEDPLNYTTR